MAFNLNGPPTIILIQGARAPQFNFSNQFKWAPYNNIVPGGPGPFSLMSTNQFKRLTHVKLRAFILKVAN